MDSRPQAGRVVEQQGESHTEPRVIERSESLLDIIADGTCESAPARLDLPSGRKVIADTTDRGERIRIESPSGEVELSVILTPNGPLLSFRAADLELSSAGAIKLDCKRLDVRAEEEIVHTSGGDVKEIVSGNKESRVGGTSTALARDTVIESKRGDVRLVANDDVQLLGERIKLNC